MSGGERPPASPFASARAAPRLFGGQAWSDMTQYEGHERESRAAPGDTAARERRCTKGFLFARPLEGSGPGEHLIHFFLRAINLFKHQNHFASQEQERRLSFLLQSTRGSVSQGEGAVTTLPLLLPFPFKTKTREGMHYHISEIIKKILLRVNARSQ